MHFTKKIKKNMYKLKQFAFCKEDEAFAMWTKLEATRAPQVVMAP